MPAGSLYRSGNDGVMGTITRAGCTGNLSLDVFMQKQISWLAHLIKKGGKCRWRWICHRCHPARRVMERWSYGRAVKAVSGVVMKALSGL